MDIEFNMGELAGRPAEALAALLVAAETDGANPDDWLEKAIKSIGGVKLSVEVSQEPRFKAVGDATAEALAVHDRVMVIMKEAIRERLKQAAKSVDVEHHKSGV